MSNLELDVHFNDIHPKAVYIQSTIQIVQEYTSRVRSTYPDHHLILKVMNDFDVTDFIHAGFTECRRTYEEAVGLGDLISLLAQYKNNENLDDFVLNEALLKLSYEVYESTHKVNPVKKMTLNEWKTVIGRDLDFDHSILIRDDKENISAFLFMYHACDESKEIGYIYYRDDASKGRLSRAMYKQFSELIKLNIKEIHLEVDNTDRYSYDFFESF